MLTVLLRSEGRRLCLREGVPYTLLVYRRCFHSGALPCTSRLVSLSYPIAMEYASSPSSQAGRCKNVVATRPIARSPLLSLDTTASLSGALRPPTNSRGTKNRREMRTRWREGPPAQDARACPACCVTRNYEFMKDSCGMELLRYGQVNKSGYGGVMSHALCQGVMCLLITRGS